MSTQAKIARVGCFAGSIFLLAVGFSGCGVIDDDDNWDSDPKAVVGGGSKNGAGDTASGETVKAKKPASASPKLGRQAKASGDEWEFVAGASDGPTLGDSLAAVALPGRKALFTGGYLNRTVTKAAFLYDGNSDSWKPLADMGQAREQHQMVLLQDGRVLILGGDDSNDVIRSTEFFDPATEQFSPGPDMLRGRNFFVAAVLNDGRVLAAGGDPGSNGLSAEIYDPASNQFASVGALGLDARAGATLLDGRVLLVGSGFTTAALLFDPATNQFVPAGDMTSIHGVLPTATRLVDGRVLVAGGLGDDVTGTEHTELFSPGTDTFVAGPAMSVGRERHVAILLPDGMVMLAGGSDNGDVHDGADLFDPSDNTITPMAGKMAAERSDFAGVGLIP